MAGRVYYGTKRAEAWPQVKANQRADADNREPSEDRDFGRELAFRLGRGLVFEPRDTPGYAIRYPDGYESWSPAGVFEAAYRPADRMGFEGALAAMREGRKVRRCTIDAENVSMWLADGKILVQRAGAAIGVWQPNTESLLADWMVVE